MQIVNQMNFIPSGALSIRWRTSKETICTNLVTFILHFTKALDQMVGWWYHNVGIQWKTIHFGVPIFAQGAYFSSPC